MPFQPKDSSQDGHKRDQQSNSDRSKGIQPRQMSRRMGRSMNRFGPKVESKASDSSSLDGTVQAKMENAFQEDFSDVKVTKDSDEATQMGAQAFTQGDKIHFAPGNYKPHSTEGQELIGHELTHVVQQKQGRVKATTQAKGAPVNDDPALENEADVMGKKAASGEQAVVQKKSESGVVQRQEPDNPLDNLSVCVPFPDHVDKDQLINQANSKVQDIRALTATLIRNCLSAISNVEHLIALEDTELHQIFVQKLLGTAVDKIAGANKILEASYLIIKAGVEASNASGGAQGNNNIALSFVDINSRLQSFDRDINSHIQNVKNNFALNYNLTRYFASLEISGSDFDQLESVTNAFETSIWKEVLPLKWKHMVSSRSSFHTNLDFIERMESKHKNIYFTYEEGTQGLFFKTEGYYVQEHWLGSGSSPLFHSKAPEQLADHLFTDLEINKKDLFENWGLPSEMFVINTGGPYGY